MRACWTGEPVQYHGEFWQLDGIRVLPRPVQQPMPVWIGGNSEAAVRRTARFGDGWIPSFIEPEAFRSGITAILDGAAAAGRSVPEDHFGVVMHFCLNAEPRVARALARPFVPKRAGQSAIQATAAFGPPELVREQLERYVSAGGSKFILRPACPPERMIEQLEWLANEVIADFHRR
jgi:alkanesulfonate monooxygenase SsuD/methylene tetrahydromethanopterin reductase-like flavin-dependent oxidoreductase (luciferase family)